MMESSCKKEFLQGWDVEQRHHCVTTLPLGTDLSCAKHVISSWARWMSEKGPSSEVISDTVFMNHMKP